MYCGFSRRCVRRPPTRLHGPLQPSERARHDGGAEAMRRILGTGAVIRSQAPVIRHVNDNAAVWSEMWRRQVALGAVPYYMFVERDTGPKQYFQVPLARALANLQRSACPRSPGWREPFAAPRCRPLRARCWSMA